MSGEIVNLKKRNFKMALSIEDYNAPRRQKNDPRYVKWLFMMHYKINGVSDQRKLSYHKCTDEEYNQFYPVQRESEAILKEIREDPERGLYCIDFDDFELINLMGLETDNNYLNFAAYLVPCNFVY